MYAVRNSNRSIVILIIIIHRYHRLHPVPPRLLRCEFGENRVLQGVIDHTRKQVLLHVCVCVCARVWLCVCARACVLTMVCVPSMPFDDAHRHVLWCVCARARARARCMSAQCASQKCDLGAQERTPSSSPTCPAMPPEMSAAVRMHACAVRFKCGWSDTQLRTSTPAR